MTTVLSVSMRIHDEHLAVSTLQGELGLGESDLELCSTVAYGEVVAVMPEHDHDDFATNSKYSESKAANSKYSDMPKAVEANLV